MPFIQLIDCPNYRIRPVNHVNNSLFTPSCVFLPVPKRDKITVELHSMNISIHLRKRKSFLRYFHVATPPQMQIVYIEIFVFMLCRTDLHICVIVIQRVPKKRKTIEIKHNTTEYNGVTVVLYFMKILSGSRNH